MSSKKRIGGAAPPKLSDGEKETLNSELLPVMDNVKVYKDTFDLLVFTYRSLGTLKREYRFTLGEEMKRTLQQLLTSIYEAKKHPSPRSPLIEVALHWVYEAKVLYRAMDELGLLKSSKCAVYISYLSTISKQLTAWYKYELRKEKDNYDKTVPAGGTREG